MEIIQDDLDIDEDKIVSPQVRISIPVYNGETNCSKFSIDDTWLARGTSRGAVEIYQVEKGRLVHSLERKTGDYGKWVTTCVCFRPPSRDELTANVLFSCDVAGHIHRWHATTGKHLSNTREANQIYTLDFQPDGLQFASGGQDCRVRIYDAATWRFLQKLDEGNGETTAGHTNRIFAIKWHPSDMHVLFSGGWDSTIQIWDTRVGKSVRSIFGPRVHGEAVDISSTGSNILTGSWRTTEQLQEWDYGSTKLIRNIELKAENEEREPRLYAVQYGKGLCENMIFAGGSGSNETYLVDSNSNKLVGRISAQNRAICSLALSSDGAMLMVTTLDGLKIYDMKQFMQAI